MMYDNSHPIHSGLLDEKQLQEARSIYDRLCEELGIVGHSARDMAAGLLITMFTNGQRDVGHLRNAMQRFAAELPAGGGN
jgi:hypothetical protein